MAGLAAAILPGQEALFTIQTGSTHHHIGGSRLRRARAAELSAKIKTMPTIVNKSAFDDTVVLYGEYPTEQITDVKLGTRFTLKVPKTGEVKGVVEVNLVAAETSLISMVCVETEYPEYWQLLTEQARTDPSAPPGVVLGRYEAPSSLTGDSTHT